MLKRDAECSRQRVVDLEVGQAVRSIFMTKSKQLLEFSSKPGRYLTFSKRVLFSTTDRAAGGRKPYTPRVLRGRLRYLQPQIGPQDTKFKSLT
jgi:hypothetical protein